MPDARMRRGGLVGLWLPALVVGASALVFQSCVLISMTAIFAISAFYERMDDEPPASVLGCAARCAMWGVGSLAAAVLLGLMLTTHFGGWWNPSADTSFPAFLALLIGSVVWLTARHNDERLWAWPWPRSLVLALLAAMVALMGSNAAGSILPQCAFAFSAAALLAWTAWRLAWLVAPAMIRQARD